MIYQCKPIKHLDTKYNYCIDTNGILTKIVDPHTTRILKGSCSSNNRLTFKITMSNNKNKQVDAAALMAFMYLPNPAHCVAADLIDDSDPRRVCVENLKWKAAVGNLTNNQVHTICAMISKNKPVDDIIRKFPMLYPVNITSIKQGDIYSEIGTQYGLGNNADLARKQTVHDVCRLLEQGVSIDSISSSCNISSKAIMAIANGNQYTHISKDYDLASKSEKKQPIAEEPCDDNTEPETYGPYTIIVPKPEVEEPVDNGNCWNQLSRKHNPSTVDVVNAAGQECYPPTIDEMCAAGQDRLAVNHNIPTPGDNRVLDIESIVEETEGILNKLLGLLEPAMRNTKARQHSPSNHQQLVKLHDTVLAAWKESLSV